MTTQSFGNWNVDLTDRVGRGGFGEVFAARDGNGEQGVAKYVPKTPGASRDELVISVPPSPNVVTVVETGETQDHFVLIMPRADFNLREYILSKPSLAIDEALNILGDIAKGLAVLAPILVHRDLKPENILFLDGRWAICDFGIARYAAAATAPDTRKRSFTPAYAAPEQWTYQRATPATDIYAFGVIAFELIAGTRPFPGPDEVDYAAQHTREVAPQLSGPAPLVSLIAACLTKADQARPSVSDLERRLTKIRDSQGRSRSASLATAQQQSSERTARLSAEDERQRAEQLRRDNLFSAATSAYRVLSEQLFEAIRDEAADVKIEKSGTQTSLRLLAGTLTLSQPTAFNNLDWGYGSTGPFDVIAYSQIQVQQLQALQGRQRRSHSLYYCDYLDPGHYAWFELAFCPNMHYDHSAPFALTPGESGIAFSRTFGTLQLAWGAQQVDLDDPEEFLIRWLEFFGEAAQNKLRSPSSLPDGPTTPPRPR